MARVLVLTNLYPPHALGGYEATCRDVVERFRRRGHAVEVLTSSLRRDAEEDADEVGIHRELQLTSTFVPPPPLPARVVVERRNLRVLRARLDAARPDVVSVWNMAGLSLSLLPALVRAGVPLVYEVCDDWLVGCATRDAWMAPFVSRPGPARAAARLTGVPTGLPDLGSTGAFSFASAWLRGRCEAASGWAFPDATVLHLGVDPEDFPFAAGPTGREFGGRVLYVGRLDPVKGVPTLLRAMAQLPDSMTLDVLGPGDAGQQRDLDALVRDLGLAPRVRFAAVARHTLADRYRAADVVVFPSEWDEPFGIVPLEAMASGTPVVATGTGGSGEYLRDGENCLRFPPGDAGALASAVRRLAADAGLRDRLVAGGLETARRLTVDVLADGLERLHVAAASRPPNPIWRK